MTARGVMDEGTAVRLAIAWVGTTDSEVIDAQLVGGREWVITLVGRFHLHESGPVGRKRAAGHRWVRITFNALDTERSVPVTVEARWPYYED